ncbi:hypothetical protein F4806DRAFT_21485 [Annulohypoxylon nitens]|nr:hypothetical protein F4806DRAFT_21485 [Annulohypoxylon nitens]
MKRAPQPVQGGRPNKIGKQTASPRGRAGRRIGAPDAHTLGNTDLADLEQQDVTTDDDNDPNSHATYDHDAAAIAAAAAAQHHQQQQQQQHQQQLDLDAASILASNVHPANDHELGGPHMSDGNHVPTVEELARESGYDNFVVESALAKRLATEPGVRLAHQRRPEQILNLNRRSNVEALFAHIAGQEVVPNCKNCKKGHGPWTLCVVIPGQMCESCSNCWFNASGSRCSLHESRPQGPQGVQMLGGENLAFPVPAAPPAAMAPFNFAAPATADPVVRYTVEQSMALVRGADKKARLILMIEATARQLAYQITQYEEALAEEQNQAQANAQDAPQPVINEQGAP